MDAAVVAACVLIGVGNVWAKPSNGLLTGQPTVAIAVVSGTVGLLLWWRRRWPTRTAVLVALCHVVAFTPTALAVALYTLGFARYRRVRVLVAVTALAALTSFVALRAADRWDGRELMYSLALVVGPVLTGCVVAFRKDLAEAARAELAHVEREHQLLVQQARTEERGHIAREMHDVVAHRVSNVVLTANALSVSQAATDPDVAGYADLIREEGHQALEELRGILGILTPGPGALEARKTTDVLAASLPDLVERARGIGQEAELTVNGHPEALPSSTQRALYRVAQEGLTNAAKHAPGAPVRIAVDCRIDAVSVTVDDEGSARPGGAGLPGSGYGLIGLQERVSLIGGTFTAGPSGSGYRISAVIPHP
ncbi:sensor histidine kinase [Streptomyces sp. IBSNAI002]|uniref:sensor histidine kinase n=1 Tax=Streptomyces sp. IBSNAI002 TaxID=3457500 RepID=UPI003FD2774F